MIRSPWVRAMLSPPHSAINIITGVAAHGYEREAARRAIARSFIDAPGQAITSVLDRYETGIAGGRSLERKGRVNPLRPEQHGEIVGLGECFQYVSTLSYKQPDGVVASFPIYTESADALTPDQIREDVAQQFDFMHRTGRTKKGDSPIPGLRGATMLGSSIRSAWVDADLGCK